MTQSFLVISEVSSINRNLWLEMLFWCFVSSNIKHNKYRHRSCITKQICLISHAKSWKIVGKNFLIKCFEKFWLFNSQWCSKVRVKNVKRQHNNSIKCLLRIEKSKATTLIGPIVKQTFHSPMENFQYSGSVIHSN